MTDHIINLTRTPLRQMNRRTEGVKDVSDVANVDFMIIVAGTPEQIALCATGYKKALLGRYRTYTTSQIEKFLPQGCKPIYILEY